MIAQPSGRSSLRNGDGNFIETERSRSAIRLLSQNCQESFYFWWCKISMTLISISGGSDRRNNGLGMTQSESQQNFLIILTRSRFLNRGGSWGKIILSSRIWWPDLRLLANVRDVNIGNQLQKINVFNLTVIAVEIFVDGRIILHSGINIVHSWYRNGSGVPRLTFRRSPNWCFP
jgi:hypothetical protein